MGSRRRIRQSANFYAPNRVCNCQNSARSGRNLAGYRRKLSDDQSVSAFGKFHRSELHYYSREEFLSGKSSTVEEKPKMIESIDPKETDKPPVRCSECDRVMEHYNT